MLVVDAFQVARVNDGSQPVVELVAAVVHAFEHGADAARDERCRSLGTTDPGGSCVLAGAWAEPVSTSSAVSIDGASQREERVNVEFMLGVSFDSGGSVQFNTKAA